MLVLLLVALYALLNALIGGINVRPGLFSSFELF